MKERKEAQGSLEHNPNTQKNADLNEAGRASPGLPAGKPEGPSTLLGPEQQPHGGGINKPELNPPKDGINDQRLQRERRRGRPRVLSDEEKELFQKTYEEALRKRNEKPEPEEIELFLKVIFGEDVGSNAEKIRQRCQQDRQRRAKLAAQYKLRQVRKSQQWDGVHVFYPPPKK